MIASVPCKKSEITLRKSEGGSLTRSNLLFEVIIYIQILEEVLMEDNKILVLNSVFSIDETDLLLNWPCASTKIF